GRRVQKVSDEALPAERVRALQLDPDGLLWVGTDAGAAVLLDHQFKRLPNTEGQTITAIFAPGGGRAVLTSEQGAIFDCRRSGSDTFAVSAITSADSPLLSLDANGRAPLPLTSIAILDSALVVGTRGRGLLTVQTDRNAVPLVKEISSRPRAFFVEAMATDAGHQLWFGSQTTPDDSGLYQSASLLHPEKVSAGLGTVTALGFDASGDLWAGTDGQGAARFHEGHRVERFTFASTAGG